MTVPQSEPLTTLNYAEALAFCDDDPELLREIARSFQQTWPGQVAELQGALTAGDARRFGHWAHALKSKASVIAAGEVTRAALELERLGRSGELSAAPAARPTLMSALERLAQRLQQEDLV